VLKKEFRQRKCGFFRRMQKIPWTAKLTNESVLIEVNRSATLMDKIRTQYARFIKPVMRRHRLEHLLTTAKIEGKELEQGKEKKF